MSTTVQRREDRDKKCMQCNFDIAQLLSRKSMCVCVCVCVLLGWSMNAQGI